MDITIATYELPTLRRELESATGPGLRFASTQFLSGVHDPVLDDLLWKGAATANPQERDTFYAQASKYISDNAYAPFLFAFAPTQISVKALTGPGLTSRIPPIFVNTGVIWLQISSIPRDPAGRMPDRGCRGGRRL